MSEQDIIDLLTAKVPLAFAQYEKYMAGFDRNAYSTTFDLFVEEQEEWLKAMELSDEQYENTELLEQIAKIFSATCESSMDSSLSKSKKEKEMLSRNLFMVTYVLPGILEFADRRKGKKITDEVCKEWAVTFKNSNIQASSAQDIDAGFKRKLCYITTATCKALNLEDNCEELMLLRNYRDTYMSSVPEGETKIREYYDIAPTIVNRINKQENADAIYETIYSDYISKCVNLIREGANAACMTLYEKMVLELKNKYVLQV